jgi:hypothetical protein
MAIGRGNCPVPSVFARGSFAPPAPERIYMRFL